MPWFWVPRRKKHRYFRCFLLRESQKKMKTQHFWLFDNFGSSTNEKNRVVRRLQDARKQHHQSHYHHNKTKQNKTKQNNTQKPTTTTTTTPTTTPTTTHNTTQHHTTQHKTKQNNTKQQPQSQSQPQPQQQQKKTEQMGDILGNINTPWVITRVRSPTINKLGLYESWGSSSFGLTIYPYGSKYLLIESMAGGWFRGYTYGSGLEKTKCQRVTIYWSRSGRLCSWAIPIAWSHSLAVTARHGDTSMTSK